MSWLQRDAPGREFGSYLCVFCDPNPKSRDDNYKGFWGSNYAPFGSKESCRVSVRPIPAYKAGLYGLTESRQLSNSNPKTAFIPVHRTGFSACFNKKSLRRVSTFRRTMGSDDPSYSPAALCIQVVGVQIPAPPPIKSIA